MSGFGFILTIHVVVSIILIFLVLLQSGKGAEMGAAFGGMGQADSILGATTFISKFTAGLAITFMITSLTLAYMSSNNSKDSVIDTVKTPTVEQKVQEQASAVEETAAPAEKAETAKK